MDTDLLVQKFMQLLALRSEVSMGEVSPGYQLGWLEGVIKDIVDSSDASKQEFERQFRTLSRTLDQDLARQEQLAVPN